MYGHGIFAFTDFHLRLSRLYKIEFQLMSHQAGLLHQVSLSKPSTSTLTRHHRVELLHQTSSGKPSTPNLIKQSFRNNVNQVLSSRASTSMPTRPPWAKSPHQRQPDLIRQSFYTDANHASLGRAFTPGINEQTLHINVN